MTDLEKLLEPEVGSFRQSDQLTLADKCAMSSALSLKRIADSLSALNTAALTNTIQNLAWEAGRSFAQGQRTDR
jgi:hypothetical protein